MCELLYNDEILYNASRDRFASSRKEAYLIKIKKYVKVVNEKAKLAKRYAALSRYKTVYCPHALLFRALAARKWDTISLEYSEDRRNETGVSMKVDFRSYFPL